MRTALGPAIQAQHDSAQTRNSTTSIDSSIRPHLLLQSIYPVIRNGMLDGCGSTFELQSGIAQDWRAIAYFI
ncbi:hypothetical protein DQG23_17440 [Paenibacillus contaminans]|uniref:Uncharacterized protein n=1 Tax=Paenibacillus contaminans TaxID=450362 RepID=A0A329MKA7_9BACL|nr:hypothetical protein DQG23_17440 [Paenibacillus contaminans]